MDLKEQNIKISQIAFDPNNPRFESKKNALQETIQASILDTREAKELLKSMKQGIKWVNKIVIRKIEDYPQVIKLNSEYQYIAVEGNTRLACLKSGAIKDVDIDYICPVLIAEKSQNETDEEYEAEIRITQGIANVMVVKQWSTIAKAKHLHQIFLDQKKRHNFVRAHDIYKNIAEELGMTIPEVRSAIIRFTFFDEISEQSERLENIHWGYLEAFDRTLEIRNVFGLSGDFNEFIWDGDEESDFKLECLKSIPQLIKKAISEGLNTKEFRAAITTILAKNNHSEELYEKFNLILGVDDADGQLYSSILSKTEKQSDKEEWNEELTDIYDSLSQYPILADWAKEFLDALKNIQKKTEKIISTIDE